MISATDVAGGAARVARCIGDSLDKKHFDVKFIVGKKFGNNDDVYELSRNSFIDNLGQKYHTDLLGMARYLRAFVFANDLDFGAKDEILNHPWYKRADIVHLHNIHSNYFKFETLEIIANTKPTVWTLHDKWPITAHCMQCNDCKSIKNRHFTKGRNRHGSDLLWDNTHYLWEKKKRIYNRSKNLHIVCPSRWLLDETKKSILRKKKLYLINNGINTQIFRPKNKSRIRKELGISNGKIVLGYIGNWGHVDQKKGKKFFELLINNYKDDENIHFLCIGSNPDIEHKNVLYTPYTHDKSLIAKYYNACDIFVFPSLAENFPLCTLEAMSTGLPIVSFRVGGTPEQIIHKKNGYIAQYIDINDLIKGIEYIRNLDRHQLMRIKKENRLRAETRYSHRTMANSYKKLYEQILR